MKLQKLQVALKDWIFSLVMLFLCGILYLVPPVEKTIQPDGHTVPAKVLSVDDSKLMQLGVIQVGTQLLDVEILRGKHKGKTFPAFNELRGQLELDKLFVPGDEITVVENDGEMIPGETELIAKDYDRSWWTVVLFSLFCLLLAVFGRWTGIKALFSFLFSCLVIFKLVIPLALRGYPASWVIFGCVVLLTAVIIFLVAGITRKALAAFAGAISGVFAGLAMAHIFGRLLHINGATLPFSQILLVCGYENLDLADIFTGALILASSGAVMDLAMDIASATEEVHICNQSLKCKELIASGMRVGRSVVGTMTTTLLLAYSGGFITLLMMFSIQGTHFVDVINNPLVAAEIVKTLIGSFSLVLVAPLTAVASGWIFSRNHAE